MGALTGRIQIAHLLRRAGFGATATDLDDYAKLGFAASVDRLLHPEQVADDLDAKIASLNLDLTSKPSGIQYLWLYRMVNTQRPLQEKMALFWHGHFATAIQKVRSPELMWQQNQLFRAQGLGKFQDLVLAVSKDPAMLIWLDNRTNRKQAPNENYGRELMELFTLGVGNYTELDVRAASRAFTGWNMKITQRSPDGKGIAVAEFRFNPEQHDGTAKTFLGQTGNWNGDDVIRIIMQQPAHATFIAHKLFSYFVWDNPDAATVAPFAAAYVKNNHDIRETVRAILLSPQFSSEQAYRAKTKSPAESVAGMLRQLNVTRPPAKAVAAMTLQGQQLFNPPNVGGWPSGLGWISTNALIERFNFANYLLTGQADTTTGQSGKGGASRGTTDAARGSDSAPAKARSGRAAVNLAALLAGADLSTPDKVVDACASLFLDGDAPTSIRDALVSYLTLDDDGKPGTFTLDPDTMDNKIRGAIHLTLTAPTYQLS